MPRQDPDDVLEKVKRHVEGLGMEGVEVRKLGAVPPSYAPLDSEISRAVVGAVRAVYPQGPALRPQGDASGKQGPWLFTIGHYLDGIKFVATIYANYPGLA